MTDTSLNVLMAMTKELAVLLPEVRRDPALLDDLLDPDFQEIGAPGDCARGRRSSQPSPTTPTMSTTGQSTIEHSDMAGALVAPNLVLLTYLTNDHGAAPGAAPCGAEQTRCGGCCTTKANLPRRRPRRPLGDVPELTGIRAAYGG